jgi:acyl-CoA synthetase (AMP-forming)/AMP-acid ligase II
MDRTLLNVDRHGDRIAAVAGETGVRLTYQELQRAALSWSDALDHPGKALVFLYADNSVDTLAAYHGALIRGHAVALLEASVPAEKREALAERYGPAFIVLPGADDGAPAGFARALAPSGSIHRSVGATTVVHPDLAVLLSTSGSTGSAKLVRLTLAAILANAQSIAQSLRIDVDARAITSLPPSYSYGLSVLNSHALAGASIVMTPRSILSREFWQTFSAHGCTSFAGVPSAYDVLTRLRIDRSPPASLRVMTQAGGRLAAPIAERFHDVMVRRGGTFYVMYGQTEATARMSCLDSDDFDRRKGSVGRAIPHGRFHVRGSTGAQGEIVYTGPNVMMGYAEQRGDLLRGDELGGVLATGDLGRLDTDGFLTITGRLKRIVKITGLRFNLDEVERIAQRASPVAAVSDGDRIVLFCEATCTDNLQRLVADTLGVHGDDVSVRHVSTIPLAANGKPDYALLATWVKS